MVPSLALALLAPVGQAPVAAAKDGGLGRPDVPEQRVSKVKEIDTLGAKKAREKVAQDKKDNAAQAKRAQAEQKGAWPEQGDANVKLADGKAGKARPGGVPVAVDPKPGKRTRTPATEARVTVLDQKAAEKAGITGVLLTAEANTVGSAEVSVDYSGFASVVGGNWSQRLRLVSLPACVLTTPEKAECREQTPLKSDNDLVDQSVSAQVSLPEANSGAAPQMVRSESTGGAAVFAVTALDAAAGQSPKGSGDYSATELSESSSWEAGGGSGSFTWNYGFTMPPAAAGPAPDLSLSYDSGSIDGRTATTNNQGTSVGEGFALTESYIERSYGSCDDDGHADVFDRCWKYDNARLVLNGKSSRLVKKDENTWRLADDNASTVTRSTGADNWDDNGEYWTVITGDGTKYVFGLSKLDGATDQRTRSVWTVPVFGDDPGEPGYSSGSSFAARSKAQAWRWNLDYVEDTSGNAATYWYGTESNYYPKKVKTDTDMAWYVRGGYLKEIKYGLRKGNLFTDDADAKVTFNYAERCTASDCSELTKDTSKNWPDVPFDAICAKDAEECNAAGPAFFSRKRLTGVNTYSWAAASSTYAPVDSWSLTQQYLDGGDIGDTSDQVLTLKSLKRTAKAGTDIAVNPLSFTYQMRPNRVDATDDILPLTRPRISTITSETGGITEVTLSSPECKRSAVIDAPEDSNTRSCYPQYWHINGAENASVDWFHKYRVLAVGVHDPAGQNPAVEHAYSYSGAAWHHSDDPFTPKDERTWSDWRGYQKVTVHTGAADTTRSKTVSVYLQGMNGDKNKNGTTKSVSVAPLLDTDVDFAALVDHDAYAGMPLQQVTYDGSRPIAATYTNYKYKNTATQAVPGAADHVARWVRPNTAYKSTYLTAAKTWRTQVTTTRYDDLGMVTSHDDYGQKGVGGDGTCTRTWYARNADVGINSLVSRTRTVAESCAVSDAELDLPADSSRRGDVLADTAVLYDDATSWSAPMKPTKGRVTGSLRAESYAADGAPAWQKTASTAYDTLGRPVSVTNADGKTATTEYTPATAGPLTKTVTTNPKGHKAVSFLDHRRGQALRSYDANSKKTELVYDALGRMTEVYLPNRIRGSQAPNSKFAYHLSNTKQSWVSTSTLKKDGKTYNTTYALADALLRPLQSQSPTPQGGRLLTDTRYDSRGLAYETYADIFDTTSTPNGTYTRAEYGEAPTQTEIVFDGAGRATASTLLVYGTKKWTATTSYTGDSTATTALDGGSAQRTITDIYGRTVESREYAGEQPSDTAYGDGLGGSYVSTKFTHALDGQQTSITGPDGAKWAYTYDLFGRQVTADDPDKGKSTTVYNALDQAIKSTDARGKSVLSAYDELGRATGTWAGSQADANQLTAYTYDTLLKGQPASSTRYVGGKSGQAYTDTVTAYDSLSRPTGSKLTLPADDPFVKAGTPATLEYSSYYNIDGTLQNTKEPALGGLESEIIGYTYNDLGQVTDMGGSTGYLDNVDYSALGQPQQLTMGTGAPELKDTYVTNRYEEGTGRLLRSHVTDQTHPYMLQDLNYAYDQAGNVTSIADPTTLGGTSAAETQCFAYDGHRRLTEAWTPASQKCGDERDATSLSGPAPYWTSYSYNKAGQRTSETDHKAGGNTKTTYCYQGDQPHTLTGTSTKADCTTPERSYTYDATGNTTKRPGTTGTPQALTWSEEGKLTKLVENGKSTDYLYDATGELLIRTTEGGERILYAGATEVHLKANGTTWAQRHYTAAGTAIAVRSNETGSHKLTYLAGDHHGTSSLAIDAGAEQTLSKRHMSPFGAERGKPTGPAWPDDKGFLGKTTDTTTGLTHIGAREYDPAIGQFISVDPILNTAEPQSLNGYSYAGNNPTTQSDPTGLDYGCGGGACEYGAGGVNKKPHDNTIPDAPRGSNGGLKPPSTGSGNTGTASTNSTGTTTTTTATGNANSGDACSRLYGIGSCNYGPQPEPDWHQTWQMIKVLALPDTEEWEACADGFGVNSHCGWAAADLPWFKLFKIGKLKKVDDAADVAKCTKCFLAGTGVLMADGTTKDIEDVDVGDKVQATDPETGESGPREVTRLIITEDDKHFNELSIATQDGIEKLTATYEHPFWSPSEDDWLEAGDLEPGMTLLTDDGDTVIVTANRPFTKHARTYNLTVDDLHTYYVLAGQTPVLVHNSNGSCGVTDLAAKIDVENLSMTKTVENHTWDIAGTRDVDAPNFGKAARPYMNGNNGQLLRGIMEGSAPRMDSRGAPGVVEWRTPGTMNGSNGIWELNIDANSNRIVHFLFKSTKG
jgi:RHS repeat-associated protein